jgi:hypothetical protein
MEKIKATKTKSDSNLNKNSSGAGIAAEREVDVLYQRLGSRWFAFSLVDDEVFVGSIGQDEIEVLATNKAPKRSA